MFEELKQIVKGEISSDPEELYVFSHDASIFEVVPEVIVRPRDVEDVKNIVSFVNKNKLSQPSLSITVRAGGSDMTGGPLGESIVLDLMAHFNKVLEIKNNYALTEPGVFYRDFEKETLKQNLLLPSYPASREICTVGGMVANNAGGEKSLRYGKTENYVEELDVVLSDGHEYKLKPLISEELEKKKEQNDFEGEVYRKIHELLENNREAIQQAKPDVSKNSAGYALWDVRNEGKFDLTKLFVGSQGTLGIITKIKFDLIKPNKFSKMLVVFLKDLKLLEEIVNIVNKYKPESFESYDDHTFKLALKIFPDLIKRMGVLAMFKFIPDVWAVITSGIPKLVMMVEFTGDNDGILLLKAKKCRKEIQNRFRVKTMITRNKTESNKYWTIRRESFNLLRKQAGNKKTVPFIDDIIVKPEYLPEFLPELEKILEEYKNYMVYTIAGHLGDGNFHIIPLMDLSDEKSRNIIFELSGKVYDLVLKYKGSITAEHNDGLIRTPYLEKMYGKEINSLFQELKHIFDPQNIFNPGKKVGADLEHSMSYIKSK